MSEASLGPVVPDVIPSGEKPGGAGPRGEKAERAITDRPLPARGEEPGHSAGDGGGDERVEPEADVAHRDARFARGQAPRARERVVERPRDLGVVDGDVGDGVGDGGGADGEEDALRPRHQSLFRARKMTPGMSASAEQATIEAPVGHSRVNAT